MDFDQQNGGGAGEEEDYLVPYGGGDGEDEEDEEESYDLPDIIDPPPPAAVSSLQQQQQQQQSRKGTTAATPSSRRRAQRQQVGRVTYAAIEDDEDAAADEEDEEDEEEEEYEEDGPSYFLPSQQLAASASPSKGKSQKPQRPRRRVTFAAIDEDKDEDEEEEEYEDKEEDEGRLPSSSHPSSGADKALADIEHAQARQSVRRMELIRQAHDTDQQIRQLGHRGKEDDGFVSALEKLRIEEREREEEEARDGFVAAVHLETGETVGKGPSSSSSSSSPPFPWVHVPGSGLYEPDAIGLIDDRADPWSERVWLLEAAPQIAAFSAKKDRSAAIQVGDVVMARSIWSIGCGGGGADSSSVKMADIAKIPPGTRGYLPVRTARIAQLLADHAGADWVDDDHVKAAEFLCRKMFDSKK